MGAVIYAMIFASNYGEGAYGAGAYGQGGSALDGLASTGYDILIPLFIGLSILIAGAILAFKKWRRNRKQNSLESL